MAKRGAEALACRAPCHSLLSLAPAPKRSRADFERREPRCVALQSGDKKRKRAWTAEEEKEAEVAAPRGKRSAGMKAPLKEQGWALGARPLEGAAQCQGLARRSREAEASGEDWRGCRPPKASAEHFYAAPCRSLGAAYNKMKYIEELQNYQLISLCCKEKQGIDVLCLERYSLSMKMMFGTTTRSSIGGLQYLPLI